MSAVRHNAGRETCNAGQLRHVRSNPIGVLGSLGLSCLMASMAGAAQTSAMSGDVAMTAGAVIVHSALGGYIFGYEIDGTGTLGLLSEATGDQSAVETFDPNTGEILTVVAQGQGKNDFVTLGIANGLTGLIESEHVTDLYVDDRTYSTLSPLGSKTFTGKWTPPLTADDIIFGTSANQAAAGANLQNRIGARSKSTPDAAFIFDRNYVGGTFVFGSNVAANTFGPMIELTDTDFSIYNGTRLASNTYANRAVLGTQASVYGPPKIAMVDLVTGQTDIFTGLGMSFVNGIAVDPASGVACTTTQGDYGVEFYNLKTHAGFALTLPTTNEHFPGTSVTFDPVNKLFLVAQPAYHYDTTTSYIHVYDEQGNYIELIDQGLHIPVTPVPIALNPRQRTGFVLATPTLNTLQSFTY